MPERQPTARAAAMSRRRPARVERTRAASAAADEPVAPTARDLARQPRHPWGPASAPAPTASPGTNFALWAGGAEAVELCLFDDDGARDARIALTELTHEIWHGFVPGVLPGPALRLPGARPLGPVDRRPLESGEAAARPVRPGRGRRLRRSAAARCTGTSGTGRSGRSPTPCATTGTRRRTSPRASWSTTTGHDWGATTTAGPRRPWADSVHLRAACARLHHAPPRHPGASCAAPTRGSRTPPRWSTSSGSGVTAVELLPVHQFAHEDHLCAAGCATTGATTPSATSPRTPATPPPARRAQQVGEFKRMVRRCTRRASR